MQDQHADRVRLFMQWQQMEFPILLDPLNVTDDRVVPLKYLLDESGIVRSPRRFRLTTLEGLVDEEFPKSDTPVASVPSMDVLAKASDADGLRAWGEALFYRKGDVSGAIEAFRKAEAVSGADGRASFRRGVALRRRFESKDRERGDFAAAAAAWTRARRATPGQYIWMRRLQQYGPRMTKPYNFYGWVAKARAAIRGRGETPVPLGVEPQGAELAEPARDVVTVEDSATVGDGKASRESDPKRFEFEIVPVAPALPTPGTAIKLHVMVRPGSGKALPETMTAVLDVPERWRVDRRRSAMKAAGAKEAMLGCEFEIRVPGKASVQEYELGVTFFYGKGAARKRIHLVCPIELEARPKRRGRRGRR